MVGEASLKGVAFGGNRTVQPTAGGKAPSQLRLPRVKYASTTNTPMNKNAAAK